MNRHDFLKTAAAATASFAIPNWLFGDQPADVKTFTYKSAGGCEIKLDAHGSDPNVRKPVIVYLHTGALIVGSRRGAPPWLNPKGDHVVISIDYRLAPETKLPEIIKDVQDALTWIHNQGPKLLNIDTHRLVATGASAGGYLALMTGFCVKPRPKAIVALSGYGSIDAPWYTTPSAYYLQQPRVSKEDAYASVGLHCLSAGGGKRGKFYLYCRQNGLWVQEATGHDPSTEHHWFDPYCPVRNVSKKYPPTVLIHGRDDTDVPYEEAEGMDRALTKFKVPHKFISVPGGGHMLAGMAPDDRAKIYDETLAFVEAHSGGR